MVITVNQCNISAYSDIFQKNTLQFSIGYEFVLMKDVKYEFENRDIIFKVSKIQEGPLRVLFNKLYIVFERQENTCKLESKSIHSELETNELIDPCGYVVNYDRSFAITDANNIFLLKVTGAPVALFMIFVLCVIISVKIYPKVKGRRNNTPLNRCKK
ncbi:hypothetical protein RF11_15466 [Thelohanellus kitauei]|uniref:Uncharacterized protein n=1 Tax=Thelohanellus kitauei TaxID=669202 RepID=A0A0C2IYV3_THEKT|nr:hypothetical protein RF11_15466 [Thelohanellus kitauei]